MRGATPREYSSIGFASGGTLITRPSFIILLLPFLAASLAEAQQYVPSLGSPIDSATRRIQEKANELFEAREYQRAYVIYRNELAPIGDKYAQYTVGFMHINGIGVDEDYTLGSAWYRLAAERKSKQYKEFIEVRDETLAGMSEVDLLRSDDLYIDLRRQYSDVVLLLKLIRDDLDRLKQQTGTRLNGNAGPVMIVDPNSGSSVSAAEYNRRIRTRIEKRLRFIAEQLDDAEIPTDPRALRIDDLESRVQEHLSVVNDR